MTHEQSSMESTRGARPTLLLTALAVGAAVTAMDLFGSTIYLPYWLLAGGAIALAAVGAAVSFTVVRASIVVGLAAWMLVLPSIRWNEVKAFYIDCQQIEPGMNVADAHEMMSSYRTQTASDGKSPVGSPLDRPHITFHPSPDHSSDWCVVYVDGDRVTSVEILPD